MIKAMKYRKKPVEIEVMVFDGTEDRLHDISRWMSNGSDAFDTFEDYDGGDVESIGIETLEGVMQARRGDYIIRGVQGEFYPCKPDIFAATYEAVADD